MFKLTQDQIDALKQLHGEDLHLVTVAESTSPIVIKRANYHQVRDFKISAADERKRVDCAEKLAKACVVFPEPKAFAELVEARPMVADVVAGKVMELAGADEKAHVEKL